MRGRAIREAAASQAIEPLGDRLGGLRAVLERMDVEHGRGRTPAARLQYLLRRSDLSPVIDICPRRGAAARRAQARRVGGPRDRRLQLRRRAPRDRGPLLARRRRAASRASWTRTTCTVECPRHGSRFDLRTGKPLTPACVRARRHLPGVRRGRRHQAGGRLTHGHSRGDRRAAGAGRHQRRLQREVRVPRPADKLRLQGPQGPHARRSSSRSPSSRTSPSGCSSSA